MSKIFNFPPERFDAVIIGDPCNPPDDGHSSAFSVNTTTKGVLLPRLTDEQMNAISSPANSLLIYNVTQGAFFYYQVDHWVNIGSGGGSGGVGPTGPTGPAGSALINDTVVSPDQTFSSEMIMELLFPFEIQSFTCVPSIVEVGSVLDTIDLAWSTNYTPTALSLNNGIGSVPRLSTTLKLTDQHIVSNTTFVLTATRSTKTKTASASISFLNNIYWGVNPGLTVTPADITSWAHQLSGTRSRSITYDCSGGRYFYLAYPKRLGVASFKINSLTYSDVVLVEQDITNESGFTETYFVYRCGVIQFGSSIPLVVS